MQHFLQVFLESAGQIRAMHRPDVISAGMENFEGTTAFWEDLAKGAKIIGKGSVERLIEIEKWYHEKLKPINEAYYADKKALAEKYETIRKPITDEFFAKRRELRVMVSTEKSDGKN